jgi:hypothetical protein
VAELSVIARSISQSVGAMEREREQTQQKQCKESRRNRRIRRKGRRGSCECELHGSDSLLLEGVESIRSRLRHPPQSRQINFLTYVLLMERTGMEELALELEVQEPWKRLAAGRDVESGRNF